MKIKIPLTAQRGAGGVLHYRPLIRLEVRTRNGGFAWLEFLVDTGAAVTTIPVLLAQAQQLEFDTSRQASSTGVGGTVPHYPNGAIRFRVFGREHDWPCNFILPPSPSPPAPSQSPRRPPQFPALLGRAGVLADYKVCIHDTHVILRRRGALSKWWRRLRRWWNKPWDRASAAISKREPEA